MTLPVWVALLLCAASAAAAALAARRVGANGEGEKRPKAPGIALESTLREVAATIAARPSRPSDSLGAIVSIIAKAVSADLCAFLLFEEASGELVTQPGAYGLSSGQEGSLYRLPLNNDTSSSVRVFKTGLSFLTGDAQSDPRVISHYVKLWKCHSLMVVPLTLEGKRVGVLRVGSFQKDFFSAEHLRFVELLAEEAVVILGGALLTQKLRETNQRLEELNRLKDEFVSTVSHEFKTPLTSIKGFATVMLEGSPGPINADQRKFLTIIQNACDRLTMLVSELLDISRLEAGVRMEMQEVSLEEMLRVSQENLQWQAESRGIRLSLELRDSLPPIQGDPRWLRQVVDNLLSNAIKFTPKGGSVCMRACLQGDAVEVTVEDTGVGIAPEDQPHIFQKFYRARSQAPLNAPGTGLGLAIAKTVVEKHGGRLWFDSQPNRGSRFYFVLPTAEAAARMQRV